MTRLSSSQEIKQAYRRIALTSHPDKVNSNQREEATKKFQEIQVAYDVLQDPIRKKEYDNQTFGAAAATNSFHTPPPSFDDDSRPRSWNRSGTWNHYSTPPTPESPYRSGREERRFFRNQRHSMYETNRREEAPRLMTFTEAAMMFHPEDRRHLWLCSDEDDPAEQGGNRLSKRLYVSLQEYVPPFSN